METKFNMKTLALIGIGAVASALAQAPTPQSTPQPSTSQQISLKAIEKEKQDLSNAFVNDSQSEQAIEQEFSKANPGWHLVVTPKEITVEKDATPAPTPVPVKPTEGKK